METCDDRRLIDDYLIGREASIVIVTRWIDAALRSRAPRAGLDLEDLRQEVHAKVLANLRDGRFDGRSALRTYVHRIAMNTRIDAERRYRTHGLREGSLDGLEDRLPADRSPESTGESRDLAQRMMKSLPEMDRLILGLVFRENLSYSEIARRLGVGESAVKTRVMRCKDRLLRRFGHLFRRGGR